MQDIAADFPMAFERILAAGFKPDMLKSLKGPSATVLLALAFFPEWVSLDFLTVETQYSLMAVYRALLNLIALGLAVENGEGVCTVYRLVQKGSQ